jgi:hypothetical protein
MKGLRLKLRKSYDRRERVIGRLQQQLKDGTKPMKAGEGTTVNEFVSFKGQLPLTPTDEKRIEKALAVLEQRTGH